MLRTNLASRPFYNQRAVRIGIAVLVVVAAASSAFNAAQVLSLTTRNGDLAARAEASEARVTALRQQALVIRQSLNRADLGAVQAAAKEANELIDRRAFSWTDLFNRFEETLPAEVRIVAVRPQVDRDGRMLVAVTVVSRTVEDRRAFEEQLEATDAFSDALTRDENPLENGTLQSIIQAYYEQPAGVAAVPPAPASESSEGGAGNRTPDKPPAGADLEGRR